MTGPCHGFKAPMSAAGKQHIEDKRKELKMTIAERNIYWAGHVLTEACHGAAVKGGWWNDIHTGEPLQRNVGELLMLIVSEVAEAMEGHRKNLQDDKLPHRKMLEVELADAVIRIFDLAGSQGFNLGDAITEKLAYNAQRADHKPENRRAENGKKF